MTSPALGTAAVGPDREIANAHGQFGRGVSDDRRIDH